MREEKKRERENERGSGRRKKSVFKKSEIVSECKIERESERQRV